MAIIWTKSEVATAPTFRTKKYGNLLSDTIQGEVHKGDGYWVGWFTNHSNRALTEFRFFNSRAAATRWVNGKLREWGVK